MKHAKMTKFLKCSSGVPSPLPGSPKWLGSWAWMPCASCGAGPPAPCSPPPRSCHPSSRPPRSPPPWWADWLRLHTRAIHFCLFFNIYFQTCCWLYFFITVLTERSPLAQPLALPPWAPSSSPACSLCPCSRWTVPAEASSGSEAVAS